MYLVGNRSFLIPMALAIGFFLFVACEHNEMEEVLEFSDSEMIPARTTFDVLYTYTDSGKVKNTLQAGRVDQYITEDSSYSEISKGFELKFFKGRDSLEATLTALSALIYDRSGMMVARDSVVFVNQKGETLHTEELTWLQDSAIVYTNKFVTIERQSGLIYGRGLISNENFTQYQIKQPEGQIFVDD